MNVDTKTRRCSECGIIKPLSEFSIMGGTRYPRPDCKVCVKRVNLQTKKLREIWDKVRPDNNTHCCPVCGRNGVNIPDGQHGRSATSKTKWCLDHNHDTHQFRGWLCHTCNLLIGRLEKLGGAIIAERAMNYLSGKIPPPPPPTDLTIFTDNS